MIAAGSHNHDVMPPKNPFRFQQFTVRDDRAAMKVGTDGVVLGAWTPIGDAQQILDVGTGSGLIALMLAQRSAEIGSRIAAIDIDLAAAEQAIENFQASPWPDRLPNDSDLVHCSLNEFAFVSTVTNSSFDLVVSNPPFFPVDKNTTSAKRSAARHTTDLSRRLFFEKIVSLLTDSGRICLILPFDQAEMTIKVTREFDLFLNSKMNVRANAVAAPKRVLLEFGMRPHQTTSSDELVIETSRHVFTEQYAELTRKFHLRYQSR
jgi:tRNA1Val (adenine37-N6)-methyltransferase